MINSTDLRQYLRNQNRSYNDKLEAAIELGLNKIGVQVKDKNHLYQIAKQEIEAVNFSQLNKQLYIYKGKKILQVNFCQQYEINLRKASALNTYEFIFFD